MKAIDKLFFVCGAAGSIAFVSLLCSHTAQAREAGNACGAARTTIASVQKYAASCSAAGAADSRGAEEANGKRPPRTKAVKSSKAKKMVKSAKKQGKPQDNAAGKNVQADPPAGDAPEGQGAETEAPRLEGSLLSRVAFDASPLAVGYGPLYWGEEFMSTLRELGVNRTKIYIHWWMIESPNNEYHFDLVDAFLDQLQPGDEALISVFTSSNWGAGAVGKGFPPLDYDEYHEFIFNLVSHCQGRVEYWERDTEPATEKHWDAEKYVEYVSTQREFYEAVKEADPQALVIGGAHTGTFPHGIEGGPCSREFFEYFLANARDYFDVFDVRLYQELYTIPARVQWFRDKMLEYGYEKPIVTTEFGGPHPCQFPGWQAIKHLRYGVSEGLWDEDEEYMAEIQYMIEHKEEFLPPGQLMFFGDCGPELDAKRDRIHARDIVQRNVLALASGIETAWYWDLTEKWWPGHGPHPIFGKLRLTDLENDECKPAFYVYQRMAGMLDGISAIDALETGQKGVLLFRIERAGRGDLYVAWEIRDPFAGEDQPASDVALPSPWPFAKATDVFGNQQILSAGPDGTVLLPLTDTPVYLESFQE